MKKILMIYTAFYPENAIGSIRNTKIVKYLVREGYDITVITTADKLTSVEDPTLYCDELKSIRLVEIPYSNFFKKHFLRRRNAMKNNGVKVNKKKTSKVKEYVLSKFKIYFQEIFTFFRNRDWKKQVMKHIRKENKDYDIILSGYPSLAVHQIAHKLKNQNNLWIADFRDPIPYKSLSSKINYLHHKRVQKKYSKKADRVMYISVSSLGTISKGIKDKSKFSLVPNGFDLEDLKYLENSATTDEETFRIAYVGSLYGGKRDLSYLFSSITNLVKMNKQLKDKIEIHYAGKDYSYLEEQFSKHDLDINIINHGYINRLESLLIQRDSDLVVINTWNTEEEQGIVTGKIFEAFLLKKTILGIINGDVPNSELKIMIEKSELGLAYEEANNYSNDTSLGEYLNALINQKLSSNTSPAFIEPNLKYLNTYDYEKISKKIINIIN